MYRMMHINSCFIIILKFEWVYFLDKNQLGLFTNKMKTLISVCVCVVQLTMTYDIDLKELLARAENEIKASFQSQMMTGARSSRINLNKFTAV